MQGTDHDVLKRQFLGWQCRIRQIAMRENGGRPSPGMCPKVLTNDGLELGNPIIVLLNRLDQSDDTTYFKFQVQKSNDPNVVREKGLNLLQSTYYQKHREFSDLMTSVFYPQAGMPKRLLDQGSCILEFAQFNQAFRVYCTVELAGQLEPCREAAIWHNRIFNTQLPNDVTVVKFKPDWSRSHLIGASE